MPQYTDPPYFLLKNYFDGLLIQGAPPELVIDEDSLFWQDVVWQDWDDWKWKDFNFWSWVRWIIYTTGGWSDGATLKGQYPGAGQGHGIVAEGGAGTEMWVLTPGSDMEFKPIKLTFTNVENNFFKFTQNFSVDTNEWDAGSQIFFRRNSLFHEWLKIQRTLPNPTVDKTVERYVSTDRPFMYFGTIFPTGTDNLSLGTSGTDHHIEFYGLKDWTVKALPQHNQTDRVVEMFKLYFDRLHHEAYQSLKEIPTLLDPIETDINYLGQISKLFNVTLIEEIPDELRKRQFVDSIINWLKRKGTYSSIYSIFRIMVGNTTNPCNIYERWHQGKNPAGQAVGNPDITGPTVPYMQDFNYLAYYGVNRTPPPSGTCTNGAGMEYYGSLGTSGYPDFMGSPTSASPPSAGQFLTPHYKVEIDLSCEPFGDALTESERFIIDQFTIESLLDYWELVRPVARVSHYRYLVSPITEFTGGWVPLYSAQYAAIMNSMITDPVVSAETGGAIMTQIYNSDEWEFHHNLGTEDLIIQTYDLNFNLLFPSEVIIESNNDVRILWDSPVSGRAFAFASSSVPQGLAATIWNAIHNQAQWQVLAQFDHTFPDTLRKKMVPWRVDLVSANALQAEFSVARDGWTITSTADYTHGQVFPATTWQVTHGLEVQGVQVQCFDINREQIQPLSVTASTANEVLVTFDDAITGWVLVKAVGKPLTQSGIMDTISPSGYIKFGNCEDLDLWNPAFNNDLKNPIYQINWPNFTVTESPDIYYIDADFEAPFLETDITEIGIFDRDGKLWFYTMCDPIYKPGDVGVTLHYRIRR